MLGHLAVSIPEKEWYVMESSKEVIMSSPAVVTQRSSLRWITVGLLWLVLIVSYLDRTNLSIANILIASQFHLNAAQMGLLLSVFLWFYAFASLPIGWLVDHVRPHKAAGWGMGLWSVITLISAFATSYGFFICMRAFLGIAESTLIPSGVKILDSRFSSTQRGLASSIFLSGVSVSSILGPPLLTILMLSFGWQGMFIATGIFGLVVLLVWLFVYRDSNKQQASLGIGTENVATAAEKVAAGQEETSMSWGKLFLHRSTWGMMLGNFFGLYVLWVFLAWLPGYLETARHLTVLKTGFVAALPFVLGLLGTLTGGRISDVLLQRGIAPIQARTIPIAAGAVFAAILIVLAVYSSSTALSVILLSLGFFFGASSAGLIWALPSEVAPKRHVASLTGLQGWSGNLGGALAPVVTGILIQVTGSFNLAFVIAGICSVGMAISYFFIARDPILPTEVVGNVELSLAKREQTS